jgi:hypothetical protein
MSRQTSANRICGSPRTSFISLGPNPFEADLSVVRIDHFGSIFIRYPALVAPQKIVFSSRCFQSSGA